MFTVPLCRRWRRSSCWKSVIHHSRYSELRWGCVCQFLVSCRMFCSLLHLTSHTSHGTVLLSVCLSVSLCVSVFGRGVSHTFLFTGMLLLLFLFPYFLPFPFLPFSLSLLFPFFPLFPSLSHHTSRPLSSTWCICHSQRKAFWTRAMMCCSTTVNNLLWNLHYSFVVSQLSTSDDFFTVFSSDCWTVLTCLLNFIL